ncbi:MAG: GntR family transcriptional regulator [Ruminococcaceae bacterium]|nr:GntR family transcriptional regulator [Oscillospiraceae bacterium]
MLQIDLGSRVPIHEQLVNGVLRLRTVGVLKSGDKLPSVRALAQKLGINPNTVQKAYAALEENGVIYSIAGKGSFLSQSDAAQQALVSNALSSFKEIVQKAKSIGISEKELISALDEIYIGGK